MLASVPPVSIMSASPYLISLRAIPMASLDEAHAEITVARAHLVVREQYEQKEDA